MRTRFVILLAMLLMLASCEKTELPIFAFINNPITCSAKPEEGLQEFGFATSGSWTITWDPVDWVSIDERQLAGNAARRLGMCHIIQMEIERNRKNEDRIVEFTVHSGGEDHVMRIIQAKPELPESPLQFTVRDAGKQEGGMYEFNVPSKYEITVDCDCPWIQINDVDYYRNRVSFSVAAKRDGRAERSGVIKVLLSDGSLLGTATIAPNAV